MTLRFASLLLAAIAAAPLRAVAQAGNEGAPAQVSATDYARAEALIGWNARELVIDDAVSPKWMSAHSFWYRNHSPKGYEFLVVDAATGAKRALFDPVRLASELSQRADTAYDPAKLPFRELTLVRDGKAIQFDVGKKRSLCIVARGLVVLHTC